MHIFLLFACLFSFPTVAHTAHLVFGEQWAQDKRLLPKEEYVTIPVCMAETEDDLGDYFQDFARRVLAKFVLRAAQLGFAKELDLLPTPGQTGVTEIEFSPGITKFFDTSRINKAIHAKIMGDNGLYLHRWPHDDDIAAAFQALRRDEETKQQNNLPEPTINPIWYEHFGQP